MPAQSRPELDADFPTLRAALARNVDDYLVAAFDRAAWPAPLDDAVRYAVLGGGKRLRPVLTLLACHAAGGSLDRGLPAAAAIELIHCFSLVHDDLPAMDDDDLRRGRPTLHIHAGEAMAILTGDLLMSLAFDLMLTGHVDDEQPPLDPLVAAACCRDLAAATSEMVVGQVYDTCDTFDPNADPLERLRITHRGKTAALFRAACILGGRLGGADEHERVRCRDFADAVGLMFQIVDDILDVTQTDEQLGKTAGKDAAAGKRTYPALLGLDASRAEVRRLADAAVDAGAPFGRRGEPLVRFVRFIAERDH